MIAGSPGPLGTAGGASARVSVDGSADGAFEGVAGAIAAAIGTAEGSVCAAALHAAAARMKKHRRRMFASLDGVIVVLRRARRLQVPGEDPWSRSRALSTTWRRLVGC